MPLDQWIVVVRPHLDKIEAGADICLRHCQALPLKPDFLSAAEHDLVEVDRALTKALMTIRRALQAYHAKEVER
jgi:hypothetical protein